MYPSMSERIRTGPNTSEFDSENFRKRENFQKLSRTSGQLLGSGVMLSARPREHVAIESELDLRSCLKFLWIRLSTPYRHRPRKISAAEAVVATADSAVARAVSAVATAVSAVATAISAIATAVSAAPIFCGLRRYEEGA